ncbi:hypothetical protein RintRC_5145 [Richelia intracellularis]|nr:hypothetical protein RintRC_5145 [Richelia intracellularis]
MVLTSNGSDRAMGVTKIKKWVVLFLPGLRIFPIFWYTFSSS